MAIDRDPTYENGQQLEELRHYIYRFVDSLEHGDPGIFQTIPTNQVEEFLRSLGAAAGASEAMSLYQIAKYLVDGPKREAELRADFEAASASLDELRAEINWTDGRIVEVEVEPTPEPYVWRDTIVTMSGPFRDEIVAMIDKAAHALDPTEHPQLVVSLLALMPLVESIPEYNNPGRSQA